MGITITRAAVAQYLAIAGKYAPFERGPKKGIYPVGTDPRETFQPIADNWRSVMIALLEDDPSEFAQFTLDSLVIGKLAAKRKWARQDQQSKPAIKQGTIRLVIEALDAIGRREGFEPLNVDTLVERVAKELEK